MLAKSRMMVENRPGGREAGDAHGPIRGGYIPCQALWDLHSVMLRWT